MNPSQNVLVPFLKSVEIRADQGLNAEGAAPIVSRGDAFFLATISEFRSDEPTRTTWFDEAD